MTDKTLNCEQILARFCKIYGLSLNRLEVDGGWHVSVTTPVSRPCVCYSGINDATYLSVKSTSIESAFEDAVNLILHYDQLAWIGRDGTSMKLDLSSITTLEALQIDLDLKE